MTGFLFDENLPAVVGLETTLRVLHATDLSSRMSDSALWDYAKRHDLAVVTKDADFSGRIIISQPPPRVVHLRIGNMRRCDFESWLIRRWPQIEAAVKTHKLTNIFFDSIEAVQ